MVQFAKRMDLLKGSEIRELLKLTAQPDIISFAGGMPAPELFPVEQMMEASVAVLKENGSHPDYLRLSAGSGLRRPRFPEPRRRGAAGKPLLSGCYQRL